MTHRAGLAASQTRAPWLPGVRRSLAGTGGAFIGLLAITIGFTILNDSFLTERNLLNIADQVSVLGILALGATLVIITGGIDLSVGSVLALCTMVLAWLSHDGGWPLWAAMVAATAVGALAGLVNGLAVTIGKLPPFIATLAMMSIARGLANLMTDGRQIVGYPEWFYSLPTNRAFGLLSATVAIGILLYVVVWVFLRYRASGRAIYAIGGGREVARLAGVMVNTVTTSVYVVAGALAGVGGIVLAARLDSSQPSAGAGLELDVIAAVVIGGASLMGGSGRVSGTAIGVMIIGVLRNGLNLLGVSPFVQQIVIGLVIAFAVGGDVFRQRAATQRNSRASIRDNTAERTKEKRP